MGQKGKPAVVVKRLDHTCPACGFVVSAMSKQAVELAQATHWVYRHMEEEVAE